MTDTKKAPTLVTVEAVQSEREWVHQGKTMQPGDRAQVSLEKAAKLEKAGVAKLVQ